MPMSTEGSGTLTMGPANWLPSLESRGRNVRYISRYNINISSFPNFFFLKSIHLCARYEHYVFINGYIKCQKYWILSVG